MPPGPPLRTVIERFGLRADKRLGQHFLLDSNLLQRIVAAAGDLRGRTVLEVGPGPGGLTRALLASPAARIIAIERDPRCVLALRELADAAGGRLQLLEADALTIDLADLTARPLTVVANLPYNIGTPLLMRWLDRLERLERLTLMFQREVAARIVAPPGNRVYGRLSVLVQWLCEARCLMHLPGRAFVPPPKVASSLIQLTPRQHPLAPADKHCLERVLAAAFQQRRKMLRASLRGLTDRPEALLEAAGVPATARAEQIDVAAFCRLARCYEAALSTGCHRR
ncbi:MAG TPA: 16S rRNA (adenine(1518)-N(6)/adenine(1519)-N(6))-dimethyltransferase RsmA [Geminicoccaceae bacterium]|nr:16S rRNA (adenine(1518)-N(6)/adenine(1519)-N(6))-dimethyltransferase RsmA [Geminicoccaceae bacterium]